VEDDPELATLSYLEDVASECRGSVLGETPPSLREAILGDLSRRLPKPKPVTVKVVPKTLAGFSENVPVMTQTEDNIPQLISRAPQIAGAIALAAGVIALLYWGIGMLLARPPASMPTFSWVEVRQAGKSVTLTQKPNGWVAPKCANYDLTDPSAKREYVSIPDFQQMQRTVGFPIRSLPRAIDVPDPPTSTVTYGMNFSGLDVAFCEEEFNANDRGVSVKVEYMVTRTASRSDPNRANQTSDLSVFQARQFPTILDAGSGTWKEVTIGGSHGVYWRGGPYRDPSDARWIGDVSVMVLERGENVMMLVGQASAGITEEFMAEVVRAIDTERRGEENLKLPPFTWVDVWRGSELLLGKNLPADWEAPTCDPGRSSLFLPAANLEIAQGRVDYPIIMLPQSLVGPDMLVRRAPGIGTPAASGSPDGRVEVTLPTTYTMSLADVGVQACSKETEDPSAKVKMRYVVRFETPTLTGEGLMRDIPIRVPNVGGANIVVFESRRTPAAFYVEGGQWKTVKIGEGWGVYWSGFQYRDMEGIFWSSGTNVLIVERGDMVLTLISSLAPESLLITLAEALP
jgi:hypothetical protein